MLSQPRDRPASSFAHRGHDMPNLIAIRRFIRRPGSGRHTTENIWRPHGDDSRTAWAEYSSVVTSVACPIEMTRPSATMPAARQSGGLMYAIMTRPELGNFYFTKIIQQDSRLLWWHSRSQSLVDFGRRHNEHKPSVVIAQARHYHEAHEPGSQKIMGKFVIRHGTRLFFA